MHFTKIKIRSLFLLIILSSILLSSCTYKNNSEISTTDEQISITIFDKNTTDDFTDNIAKEICNRTGINIKIMKYTGTPVEKLNLMLAAGDYPDIVIMDKTNMTLDKYISEEALLPMNFLINRFGPNIMKMYSSVLNKIKSEDGNIYNLPNWYGYNTDPTNGFIMRQDILATIVGQDAYNGHAFSQEEFRNILKEYKYINKDNYSSNSAPLIFNTDDINGLIDTMKGMFGMKTYYENNGVLYYDVRDPKYIKMLKYFNSLYRDGLVDKNWIATKQGLWNIKLLSGNVFATTGNYLNVMDINATIKSTISKDAQYYPFKVIANGISETETTYGGRNSLGSEGIAITKNCKDPEKAIKLIDFLASEEGQYLMLWGIEGKTWNYVNGIHTPTENIIKSFNNNFKYTPISTGVRHWTWFIKNGVGEDGTPFDMALKYNKPDILKVAEKNLSDTYWDMSPYDQLLPKSGTDEAIIYQTISDKFTEEFPKIIDAKSEEECVNRYNQMITEMDALGLKKLEEVINKNYDERKKQGVQ